MAYGYNDAPQTAWYEGVLLIGGIALPALAGLSGGTDENYIDSAPIGNRWAFHDAPGLIQPQIQCSFEVRDNTFEVMGNNFLSYAFGREQDTSHDTDIIPGGCVFYDGASAYYMDGVKFGGFSMSTAKGEALNFQCNFSGTTWNPTSVPSHVSFDTSPPLVYDNVTFGGSLAGIPWRFGLTYSNNLHPGMALDGLRGPSSVRAGMMTGSLQVECPAKASYPVGYSAASIVIAGANVTRTFNLTRIRCDNPRQRQVGPPEVMRNLRYTLKSTDPRTTPILTYS